MPGHGVLPRHVTLWDGGELVAAAPLFLKGDGRGEFLYDSALAVLAGRAGVRWYPKAVSMGPYAPFDVPHLLVAPGRADREVLADRLVDELEAVARGLSLAGVQHLFVEPAEAARLVARGYAERAGYQLAWRRDGCETFEAWLAGLRSKERVRTKRELRRVEEAGLTIEVRAGDEVERAGLDAMFGFYEDTCARHGTGSDYLKRGTWDRLLSGWRHRLVLILAREGARPVGGALLVHKGHDLYGRYWGAEGERRFLYFTLAFYRPIAWAIERGVERFHAGAGVTDHKLLRGFRPVPARSLHKAFDLALHSRLAAWVEAERVQVERELAQLDP